MKRSIISAALIAGCFLLSFTLSGPVSPNANNNLTGLQDTTKKNKSSMGHDNTLAIYKGIEGGDLSVMDKFVSKDIIDHGGMEDIRGLENVKKMLSDIHNHFTNLKISHYGCRI